MRKKFLLLLALLFLLAGVIFVLPAVRDHVPDQTKESAAEETEPSTTESEPPTETETESETGTETEEPTEEETEGPGDPVDREKIETHLIIASDTHYMSPSLTDYGVAFDQLVNSSDGKEIRYQPQLWQAFESEACKYRQSGSVLQSFSCFSFKL